MRKIIDEQLEKAEKDYRRFYEVGDYYYEQENYTQALANYVDSFSAYARYMEYAEGATLALGIEDFHAGLRSNIPSEVSFTIKQRIDFFLP